MLWPCSVRSMSCAATGSDEWEALITSCVGYLYNGTALTYFNSSIGAAPAARTAYKGQLGKL